VTRAVFTGHESLSFQDYTDLATGRTLTAVPGGVYEVAPASGRSVPEVPAGWFVPVGEPVLEAWAAEPDAVPEPEAEPEPTSEPEPAPEPEQAPAEESSEGEPADG